MEKSFCIIGKNKYLERSRKKVLFLMARPLRPPRASWTHFFVGIFFRVKKKFFFSGPAFTPLPPLSGRATKKKTLFAASLSNWYFFQICIDYSYWVKKKLLIFYFSYITQNRMHFQVLKSVKQERHLQTLQNFNTYRYIFRRKRGMSNS